MEVQIGKCYYPVTKKDLIVSSVLGNPYVTMKRKAVKNVGVQPKKKVYSYKKRVRRLPKQELKMFPTNATASVTALTYTDLSITEVAQGDDYTNRDGRKVTPMGLWLRESFIPGDSSANVMFRRVVFIDWAYQGVAHGYADVFYNTSPMTTKSYQNTERIQIIRDDFVTLSNVGSADGFRAAFKNDEYIDLSKYYNQTNRTQIQYSGTTGGSVSTGAIFIALLCDKSITFSSTTNVGYQVFSGFTFLDA